MDLHAEYILKSEQMIIILEKYFNKLGLYIVEQPVEYDNPQKRVYFLLNSKNGEEVGIISVSNTTHMYLPYTTRASFRDEYKERRKEDDAIWIAWLSISGGGFQGTGLGTALLFYGICKTYLRAPGAKYIKLDDDSDRSKFVNKNIYHSLGLVNVGLVSFKDISVKGAYAEIELGKNADNSKEGSITTFFDVAYPTYLGKYHNKQNGGKNVRTKKSHIRKMSGRNKKKMMSRSRKHSKNKI